MPFNGSGSTLSSASDVVMNSPSNDQSLTYNSSTAKWGNKTITKSMVGLSNVDNTADTAKPVSTFQQSAIDAAKVRTNHTGVEPLSGVASGTMLVAPLDGSINTNSAMARPSSRTDIFFRWRSTVQPTNMITGDEWYVAP